MHVTRFSRGLSIAFLFLFFAACLPAYADEAADLLAKHKAFVGWQFGDGTINTMRLHETRSTAKETLDNAIELRSGAAFRATHTNSKGLVENVGFTGRLFWISNENGFTRPILGDALRSEIANQILFGEGSSGLIGTYKGTKTIDGQNYGVVRVSTLQSDEIELYIDPQTGAYKRAIIDPSGTYEQTIDILGYGDALPGKRIINKWKYHDSQATHEVTKIEANVPVSLDDLHPPKQTATWTFANKQPFKITVTDRRVYVDASVNGVPGRFILDTGAAQIVLTQKFADRAHVKKVDTSAAIGIGGETSTNVNKVDTLTIGGNTLSNVVVASSSLDLDTEAPDGLIGFDLFGGAIVTLDTSAQTMTINDPATTQANKDAGINAVVDLTSGQPALPMKINGNINVNAILDSGNTYYVFFGHDLIDKYGLRMLVDDSIEGVLRSHPFIGGVGGIEIDRCGQLDSVSVGPIVYQPAPGCESSSFSGKDALVGFDFFKNFNYIFDYPESLLIMIPHQ